MNITQIEINVKNLLENFNQETFIYDLLLAFGLPKASISRLQKSGLNLSKIDGEILWKKKLFFKVVANSDLYSTIDSYKQNLTSIKHDPRFIIITDYQQILAIDSKTLETLDSSITELNKNFTFFLPWAGMEKATYQSENPADVKAAEKMARLFDELKKDNPQLSAPEQLHSLNVFLSRLLFCFFAEDTGIFQQKLFTNAINNYTQADGDDLHSYLDKIFSVMNHNQRDNLPDYIGKFPYVNGGLFRDTHPVPQFSFKSRQLLLDNGELDWSVINPDIFGSMMQAVVDSAQRSGLGMHYTSVPNIMKVIEPLFLNELKEEFENSNKYQLKAQLEKLNKLHDRISKIKIFDPACGSGNFLIIAYKELRNLEIEIIKKFNQLDGISSLIHLHNFYGIEIDDFAHEIAKLSLWLAEHQMNMKFKNEFGFCAPALPLKDSGNIVCANACRIDWDDVCPKTPDDEIYVLGNPPYIGSRKQNNQHTQDLKIVFDKKYKSMDYIAAWFFKASSYIREANTKVAFVTTNSICQGEQVSIVWENILKDDIEICFAYKSFKWSNNAKAKAAVIVTIIGLANKKIISKKTIYNNSLQAIVNNISPYLIDYKNIYVYSRSKPLSKLPEMNFGNMPADGGNLLLTPEEKVNLISEDYRLEPYIKKFVSADEFLNGKQRFCFWLVNQKLEVLKNIPLLANRINKIHELRLKSARPKLANTPHLFAQITQPENADFILIPRVSSENREYIPIGYFDKSHIVSDTCLSISNPQIYHFGILTSKIHMVWVNTVCGRLKTDYRYSKDIVYNNFPFPTISEDQKKRIEMYVFDVLDEREKHSEKTLAELYDPEKMPEGLRQAHHNLDIAIEQCYRTKPFASDEERLEHLFTLYEQMTSKGYTSMETTDMNNKGYQNVRK